MRTKLTNDVCMHDLNDQWAYIKSGNIILQPLLYNMIRLHQQVSPCILVCTLSTSTLPTQGAHLLTNYHKQTLLLRCFVRPEAKGACVQIDNCTCYKYTHTIQTSAASSNTELAYITRANAFCLLIELILKPVSIVEDRHILQRAHTVIYIT